MHQPAQHNTARVPVRVSRVALGAILVLLASASVGCGDSNGSAAGGSGGSRGELPTVPDDAFYLPPDPFPSAVPGTLIRSQEVAPIADDSRTFVLLYVSESLVGEPIAVSGFVVVPDGPAPEGGFNTVSWAHGTKGVSDACAPSRGFSSANHDFFAIAPELVEAGYLAVSSDYEGLGAPGLHPYLAGESQARGSLDIVRAAAQLNEVEAITQVAVWGRSQGGQTALFAGEIAPSWAPELDLVGVISAAPASSVEVIVQAGMGIGSVRGFAWMTLVSFAEAFGLDDEPVFTEEGRATIDQLLEDEACYPEWLEAGSGFGSESGVAIDFAERPDWQEAFRQSSVGRVASDVPVLLLQGSADTTTPKPMSDRAVSDMCAIGTRIDYRVFEGFSHNDSTALNMPLMLEWTAERFSGEEAGSTCP